MKKYILAVISPLISILLVMLLGVFAEPAFAQRPSCDTSGTTVEFLSETCVDTTCTWSYTVCQTGFALSHWVLGLCDCFEGHITEVGYIDAQDNKTVMSQCTEGQTTPCWEFGLDPTTGLFGLKWDNLPGPENECWTFYFTIDRNLDEATLNWTSKFAACAPGTGTVTGPACYCDCGQILAFKYYDVNQSGGYDEGDYELEGWDICLYYDDVEIDCKTTDENGFVDFGCRTPDVYVVCETLQEGWSNSEPGEGELCHEINLQANKQVRKHFGNYEYDPPLAYIRAGKYYDYNHDGQCNDPNCPLNDWEICLDGDDCKTTSDICMLCGGCTDYWEVDPTKAHTLCETLKDGWVNSEPGVDPPCKEVTVEPDKFRCVPFGNWEPTEPVEEGEVRDRGVAVGGEVHQVNKVGVLAPWLVLALIVVIGGSILVMIRYKTG